MKVKLTKEESEQYITIVTKGNKDDMFDWAYALGQVHEIQRQIDLVTKLK